MSVSILKRATRSLPTRAISSGQIAFLQTPCSISTPMSQRPMHTSGNSGVKVMNSDPKESANGHKLVFVVTGGAQGLGPALAESLVEAGGKGKYYIQNDSFTAWIVLIIQTKAGKKPRSMLSQNGEDHYTTANKTYVQDAEGLDKLIAAIADENRGLDGVIAAAGIQHISPTIEYQPDEVAHMLSINYTGVFMTAKSAAKQMMKYKKRGSICMIASISGLKANRGLISPVYNSSKAAVIQLARNLAMEWSPIQKDGTGGIRINCISPGHIMTPMVQSNLEEIPGLREEWEREIMMGRLAETKEFKGTALFLLSNASSYMTGNNLVIDGGHSSW
ncbi:Ff.00g080540.m01.CDS01 [Fusarium sp. VM40]|nr:Ff.00g080540.m01.CDS01 [Fusarium sp. VM40]